MAADSIEGRFAQEREKAKPEDIGSLAARASLEERRVREMSELREAFEHERIARVAAESKLAIRDAATEVYGADLERTEAALKSANERLDELNALVMKLQEQLAAGVKEIAFEWPENTRLLPAQREQILMYLMNGDVPGLLNFLDHMIRFDDKLPTLLRHTYFKDEVLSVYGRHFKRRNVPTRRAADTQPGIPLARSGSTTMGFGPGSGRLGIIFIDLDNFKQLNDTKGHLAGDEALKRVANVISEGLREADIKGRFGGEEIEVAIEIENEADHFLVAEKLRRLIGDMHIEYGGDSFRVTASIGAAELAPGESLDDLIDRANWAMKFAKEKGKNRAVPEEAEEVRNWIAAQKAKKSPPKNEGVITG